MSAFRMYLWKEWREQRPAVIALAIVLPALVLTISASLPRRFLGDATFPATVVVVALVATLVAIGGELLVPDRRVPHPWLARLPGGVSAAFPAKLLVFGVSTVVALAFGFGLGLAATFLEGRDVLAKACTSILEEEALGGVLAAALALATWTFAASAWCPRGMLALCAGALMAAGLGWPLWLHELEGYAPREWELRSATLLLLVAALVSAYVGFTRGHGPRATSWSGAWRGAGAGLLCVLPLHAWSLHAMLDRDRFVLDEAYPLNAWVFGNERAAVIEFVGGHPRWPHDSRVLLFDLERKTWRPVGEPEADYEVLCDPRDPAHPPRVLAIFHDDYRRTIVLDAVDASHTDMDETELSSLVPEPWPDELEEFLCFDANGQIFSRDLDGLYRYDLTTGVVTRLLAFAEAREEAALAP